MVWHLLTSLPFPSLCPEGRNSTKLLLPEGRGMGQAPSTAALCFSVPESWGHRGHVLALQNITVPVPKPRNTPAETQRGTQKANAQTGSFFRNRGVLTIQKSHPRHHKSLTSLKEKKKRLGSVPFLKEEKKSIAKSHRQRKRAPFLLF